MHESISERRSVHVKHGAKAKSFAAVMDAWTKLGMEHCAGGMGQHWNDAGAEMKDAQMKPSKEKYAGGMVLSSDVTLRM